MHLSCLALGLPAPPEIHAELEKRAALRALSGTVRETLVAKHYLPLLREGHKGSRSGSGSVSSWEEPLGFLERKREVLLDRRSYSDSDLSKITVNEFQFRIICSELQKVSECHLYQIGPWGFSHFIAFCLEGSGVESILQPSTWKSEKLGCKGSETN